MKLMKIKTLLMFPLLPLLLLLATTFVACSDDDNETEKPKVNRMVAIVDTDIASSTDDLFLLTALYHLADMNALKFAAIMVNRNGEVNAKMADLMNTYHNHTEVQIGVTHSGPENPTVWCDYWKMCEPETYPGKKVFARTLSDTEIRNLPDAVTLYRKILSESRDHSVLIFSVGFANNLARLLMSQPDEYSSLDGVELVRRKVKGVHLQAGHYGKAEEPDYNFMSDPEHAKILIEKCPAPMFFSPQEAGDLVNYKPEDILADYEFWGKTDHPMYHVYKHHFVDPGQRMWDVLTLMQWLQPDYFDIYGPYEISITDDMILIQNPPLPTSNRYVFFPKSDSLKYMLSCIQSYMI